MQKYQHGRENFSFLVHLHHILMMIIITLISLMKFNNITFPPLVTCDRCISYNLLMLCEQSFNFTDTSFLLFLATSPPSSLGEIDNKSFKFSSPSTHFTLTQWEWRRWKEDLVHLRLTNAPRRFFFIHPFFSLIL